MDQGGSKIMVASWTCYVLLRPAVPSNATRIVTIIYSIKVQWRGASDTEHSLLSGRTMMDDSHVTQVLKEDIELGMAALKKKQGKFKGFLSLSSSPCPHRDLDSRDRGRPGKRLKEKCRLQDIAMKSSGPPILAALLHTLIL
ncbi:hypothetical protein FQN60_016442 [Etheostoma spectabile]|uniref:Uncharacterized protein n=1 Tax=Etheostoma spectabile TaxID=54343 RepID=A0A5J5D3X1_9PERO|nr:hypothetical protein FQN60_016442 [Etheostoma spectabile]